MSDLKFNGWRPRQCNKPQEELEISDFVKVIRPTINDKVSYARIPIRRKRPEDILYDRPIEDTEDLEQRIKAIVDWYKDMESSKTNIMLEFAATYLTDEELEAMEAEEENFKEECDAPDNGLF